MSSTLEDFVRHAEQAEKDLAELVAEVEALERHSRAKKEEETKEPPEELVKLREENTKLKYRLGILRRATDKEKKGKNGSGSINSISNNSKMDTTMGNCKRETMPSVLNTLQSIFQSAVSSAFPDIPEAPCRVNLSTRPGIDYQFNGAMPIAGILKGQGVSRPPFDIATQISKHVPVGGDSHLIDRLELAKPGFVNIMIKKSFVEGWINSLLKDGIRPTTWQHDFVPQRIIMDFSSPNIAKEMHVGHLRSTIIGDSLANLFEFLGHDVVRFNHIGDWGTQFGMLIAHLKDSFPDYAVKSPPIGDLVSFYKESKIRFDNDQEFKKRAYECVVKLQSHDQDHIKAWNLICDVSRNTFEKVYTRLGVRNLKERGESFYQNRMETVVKFLDDKGLLEEDEGRKVMFGDEGQVPLTIKKTGGGYTYDTSDMAALHHRIVEEKADVIVYVTDLGQETHFQTVWACARKAGILDDSKVAVHHAGFGVVLGEDRKKFKTRSGDSVRLVDLLDEGLRRAGEKLLEKERDVPLTSEELTAAQNAIAYGCIKYADLSHNRHHDYVFSFDKMLEDKGNTAVYMLYAYTRICAIARTAGLSKEDIVKARATAQVNLAHEKELKLAKLLTRLPETMQKIAKDLYLHSLCEFMYEVATTFTEFYDSCYCVTKDRNTGSVVSVDMGRILLCDATAQVLATCFEILGIEPVQRM